MTEINSDATPTPENTPPFDRDFAVALRKLEQYNSERRARMYDEHETRPDWPPASDSIANELLDATNPAFQWPAYSELFRIPAGSSDPMRFDFNFFLGLRALNDDGRGPAGYGMDIWFNDNDGKIQGQRWNLIERNKPEFTAVADDEAWRITDFSVKQMLDRTEEHLRIHNLPIISGRETIGLQEAAEKDRVKVSMSGNNLLVNGELLDTTADIKVLLTALMFGRPAIMAGLERFKRQQQELNPGAEISYAPFTVVKIPAGNMRNVKKSLTAEAIESKEQVFYDKAALKEDLHPYWNAIEQSGFVPHARLYGTRSGWHLALWAAVRERNG